MSGLDVVTYRAGLIGAPRTGKSTLLWLICLALPNVWLWDPFWEFQAPPGGRLYRPRVAERDGRRGGVFYDELQHIGLEAQKTGGITVAVEETPGCVRRGQQGPQAIGDIAVMGRHYPPPPAKATGVGLVLTAQLPKQVPAEWWAAMDHLFCFRVTSPTQLETLRALQFPMAVAKLNTGEFFHLDNTSGQPPHLHLHALDGACSLTNPAAAAA